MLEDLEYDGKTPTETERPSVTYLEDDDNDEFYSLYIVQASVTKCHCKQ
jgi:hypothetical protein